MTTELTRLRRNLLPKNQNPVGVYSNRQPDRTIAYRLLSHAEIEAFVEEIALSAVNSSYMQWNTAGRPSSIMMCLIAASKTAWDDEETRALGIDSITPLKIKPASDSLNDLLEKAVEQYREIIKNNHGIKSNNIKRIVMPLGIAMGDLDPVWVNNMTAFGSGRGKYAHSSRIGLRNVPDPFAEKSLVDALLPGLVDLEKLIKSKI